MSEKLTAEREKLTAEREEMATVLAAGSDSEVSVGPGRVPGLWRTTRDLVRAQLRYRLPSIVGVLTLEVSFLVVLLLFGDRSSPKIVTIVALVTLVLGGGLGCFGWGVETSERRVCLLTVLPVGRSAIAFSRLVGAALIQALVSGCALLFLAVAGWSEPPLFTGSIQVVAVGAWSLSMVYATLVSEEINIALSANKWILYLGNAWPLIVVAAVLGTDLDLDVLLAPEGLVLAIIVALLMAVLSVGLFRARATFDVGVSPWHGMPVSWSEERGARR